MESLMYSRKFEYEADNSGFDYLQKAHINPDGMVTFFEKLLDEHKNEPNSSFLKMLSSHPGTADRIKNLKEKESKLIRENYIISDISLKDFQNKLKLNLKP